ncbi:hypothetical protein CG709_11245, partial [Lachnotalea glycerini]
MSEIQIENVSFGYEDGMVLENASMEIKKGECVGIRGSNGTGKSTPTKLKPGPPPP